MKRIFVTGNAGSGKSTLAKKIAAQKGVAHSSLDKIVWKENWQKAPADERNQKIADLIAGDVWVIDGVSDSVLDAADQIIFLDFPRRVCLYRALKRNSRYLFTSRPELPANCPEILIVPKLIKIIWHFPGRVKPKILAKKSNRKHPQFIHITSNKQLQKILADSINVSDIM